MEQVVAYKVVDKIQLKHLYLVYCISSQPQSYRIYKMTKLGKLQSLSYKKIYNAPQSDAFLYVETFAIRQFMRGTDPTNSTWVYPKLIL